MFYIDLPLVILAKMKQHIRRLSAISKGNVQTPGRQELDSNVLNSALLHRHVLHVPKLVLPHGFGLSQKVRVQRMVLSPRNCGDITLK